MELTGDGYANLVPAGEANPACSDSCDEAVFGGPTGGSDPGVAPDLDDRDDVCEK